MRRVLLTYCFAAVFVAMAGPVNTAAAYSDIVVCEPQGGPNPTHPVTYWYDVTPDTFGRCDFHVQVYDPDPSNYTNVTLPGPTWQFAVHLVGTDEWWASWWDPGCVNAIFGKFRFQFDNPNRRTWGDWTTTTSASSNPYLDVVDSSGSHVGQRDGYGYRVHVPSSKSDLVVCEPQGGGNPTHPGTYWYDVTPDVAGRCDFHVRVFDPDSSNYTNWTLPAATWQFAVHKVGNDWWASWWSPGCANAIFSKFRFQFDNPKVSTWDGWTTTISASSDPYAGVIDSWEAHEGQPDGYGYRVHVPRAYSDVVVCEPQGGHNPTHPATYWYDVTPDTFGRCDFHVRVYDPNPNNYTNWTLPAATWQFAVHQVGNEWWASWWDPGCTNAIFSKFRFQFDNPKVRTWGDWTTTISASWDPYADVIDSSAAHAGQPDGYGYRVHVPTLTCWDNVTQCAGQGRGDGTCNGQINFGDLFALKAYFGRCAPWMAPECCSDYNQSGCINFSDLFILKTNFGTFGYVPSTGNQNCP